jgi:hypothetical protein
MGISLLPRNSRARSLPVAPAAHAGTPAGAGSPALGARVPVVHRLGAAAVALVILVFGILGFAGGLAYFSTSGEPVLGLSSNGLLSTISVVTAVVLLAAALRGARTASTVMIGIGVLFLVSALANLAVLDSGLNVLAFRFSNIVFSVAAGLVLLILGTYGRVSGNLPPDSPYARAASGEQPPGTDGQAPRTAAEAAAERAMRQAELAVVQHVASAEQRRRVAAMAQVRTRADRRRVWMEFDRVPR